VGKSPEAFRTISEVSEWLGTQAHVLRFWESKFAQLSPVRKPGGRRYYRPSDLTLLGGIKYLLHQQGTTIKAVQIILREKGVGHVSSFSPPLDVITPVLPKISKSHIKPVQEYSSDESNKRELKRKNVNKALNSLYDDDDDQLHLFPIIEQKSHTTVEIENALPSQSQSGSKLRNQQIDENLILQSSPSSEAIDNIGIVSRDNSFQALGVDIAGTDFALSEYIGEYGSASKILKLTKKQINQIFLSKKTSVVQLENLVKQMD
jgi:DNA-binding transcriptional MerR regulator